MALVDGQPATAATFNAAFVSVGAENTYLEAQTYEKEFNIKEIAAPSTPDSGYVSIYAKTDSELYFKNDAGTESKISNPAVLAVTSKTANYTALTTDTVILCDASSASFTITLYTAVGNTGRVLEIIRTDQTLANSLTIDGNSSETIGGAATKKLMTQGEKIKIVSDGTNWQILDRRIPSEWVAYTPTGSWVSNTTYTGFWRRVGDSLEINVRVTTSGAPTAADLTVSIPSGLTLDSAKQISGGFRLGTTYIEDNAVQGYVGGVATSASTTTIGLYRSGSASTYTQQNAITHNAPFTFAANDFVVFTASGLPITNWEG